MSNGLAERIQALEAFQARLGSVLHYADRLRELLDKADIQSAIYRYARGIDRVDLALVKSTFWDDAVHVGGPLEGRFADIAEQFVSVMLQQGCASTQHYMVNMHIELDGDHARSETYLLAYHRTHPGAEGAERFLGAERLAQAGGAVDGRAYDIFVGNRYLDEWQRREGIWKIARRKFIVDWDQTLPASNVVRGGAFDAFLYRGMRGRNDESYTDLKG
jgi:hypothetical protein